MSQFLISRSGECKHFSSVAVPKSRIVKTVPIFATLFCLAPCEEAPQFKSIKSVNADVLGFCPRCRTPALFHAQDGLALGMNLVDALEKAVLWSTPASLPAEVGTCVVDEAGDCRRQEPFWCSVQLHAALASGAPFLAVLQTS